MKATLIEYPACSTCRKAKKFLLAHNVELTTRHIVEETPNAEELKTLVKRSGLSLKKFFNTSGHLYKELHLKETLPSMSEDEQFTLLSENGMLIKRPILITDTAVYVGFREDNYAKICSSD